MRALTLLLIPVEFWLLFSSIWALGKFARANDDAWWGGFPLFAAGVFSLLPFGILAVLATGYFAVYGADDK